jgi:hypothetical protein
MQTGIFSCHVIVKTLSSQNKERALKATRVTHHTIYKGKHIKIIAFSIETLKARRAWSDLFQTLKGNICLSRLLYSTKLTFITEG